MEELVAHDPGSHYVRQWQPGGRANGIPEERARSIEGPERVCHLLLGDLNRHADTEQAMRNLQEYFPLRVLVQVVQEQQPKHMPTVPEQLCLRLTCMLWLCIDIKYTCIF